MASFPSGVQPSQAQPEPNTPAAAAPNFSFMASIEPKEASIALDS